MKYSIIFFLYMNDYLYKELIKPWIPTKYRQILRKQDTWLTGYRKIRVKPYKMLSVDIIIHTGSPCYRYCVCKFFGAPDRLDYFQTILSSPRSLASL